MKTCLYCSKPLPKGRRKYCSDECSNKYFLEFIAPLWWNNAVKMALKRAKSRCEKCGIQSHLAKLEVHHKRKLEPGELRHNSPKNNQDNLLVLCKTCHEMEHHIKYRNQQEAIRLQGELELLDTGISGTRQMGAD